MTRESRIDGFEETTFTHGGRTHQVFCAGSGRKPNISHAWWLTQSGYRSVIAS